MVNGIGEAKPPQQGSSEDGHISHGLLPVMLWYNKLKACHQGYEKQDDEGIGEGNQKTRNTIVPKSTLIGIGGT